MSKKDGKKWTVVKPKLFLALSLSGTFHAWVWLILHFNLDFFSPPLLLFEKSFCCAAKKTTQNQCSDGTALVSVVRYRCVCCINWKSFRYFAWIWRPPSPFCISHHDLWHEQNMSTALTFMSKSFFFPYYIWKCHFVWTINRKAACI